MKVFITDDLLVVAIHHDNQPVTLDSYPQASRMLSIPEAELAVSDDGHLVYDEEKVAEAEKVGAALVEAEASSISGLDAEFSTKVGDKRSKEVVAHSDMEIDEFFAGVDASWDGDEIVFGPGENGKRWAFEMEAQLSVQSRDMLIRVVINGERLTGQSSDSIRSSRMHATCSCSRSVTIKTGDRVSFDVEHNASDGATVNGSLSAFRF